MPTIVKQLQTKAVQIMHIVQKHGIANYKQLLDKNQHYIANEPTVEKCQELSKQLFYTRLASLPGRHKALWEELDYVKKKLMNQKDLKLEEVGIAALFTGECYAWLCVGEIVGRGCTLTGYKV